jgi:YggT family protein
VHSLGLFVEFLSIFLLIAIVLRFVLSWTGFDPRNSIHAAIFNVTEPILAPIRSILPRTGMMDFSPMIAMFMLFLLLNLGQRLAAG